MISWFKKRKKSLDDLREIDERIIKDFEKELHMKYNLKVNIINMIDYFIIYIGESLKFEIKVLSITDINNELINHKYNIFQDTEKCSTELNIVYKDILRDQKINEILK